MENKATQQLDRLKTRLLDRLLLYGSCIGFLIFGISLFPVDEIKYNFDFYIDFATLVALLVLYLKRDKISIEFKAYLIMVALFTFFITDQLENGHYSHDNVLFVLIPFLSILVFDFKKTMKIFWVAFGAYLFLGVAFKAGWVEVSTYPSQELPLSRWIEAAAIVGLTSVIIAIFFDQFNKIIYTFIDSLEDSNRELSERDYLLNNIIQSFPRSYILFLDKDLNIILCGGEEFRRDGEVPISYYGKPFDELMYDYPAEITNDVKRKLLQTLDGHKQFDELRLKDKYYSFKTLPFYEEGADEPSAMIAIFENVTEYVQSNITISENLKEKDVMLAEIHHRVKNNLAVVSGLLELQSFTIEESHAKQVLQKSMNRIMSIAKVHKMLYQSDDFSKIPFREYIEELSTGIFNSMSYESKEIDLRVNSGVDHVSINHGVPLGIIFNELITNSIKYAFKVGQEKIITITVYDQNESIQVIYEDNGVGIQNFEDAFSNSLGFKLIHSLFKQIEADYEFDTDTHFRLTFSFPADSVKKPMVEVG